MADSYKTLIQTQIPATTTQLGAAVPALKMWIVKYIEIVNVGAGNCTVQLFKNGTAVTNAWSPVFNIVPNGNVEWDGTMSMGAGEFLAGDAGTASMLTITVDGDEIT